MSRSTQQQISDDNSIRIELVGSPPLPIPSKPSVVSIPAPRSSAQPTIPPPPKQSLSSQLETPAKAPVEPNSAPPPLPSKPSVVSIPAPRSSAQPTIPPPPKQSVSSQLETPPKAPVEPNSAPPPPKSPEQTTTTNPTEPPKQQKSLKLPFVIGVSGGTASGKTAVCNMISDRLRNSNQLLDDFRVVLISQDSFYRDHGLREEELKHATNYNFDDPDAFDREKLLECIQKLKSGQSAQVPRYNLEKQCSDSYDRQVDPCDVLILKGILIFQCRHIRSLMDMKIFIDTDAEVRLARRIKRDTTGLGRSLTFVLDQYLKFVKPAFDTHIFPSRKYADFIIPNAVDNHVAMDTILQQIHKKIGYHSLCYTYTNLNVIEPTYQMRCMHTLIRDKEITKHDFIFHSDRLARLVVEHGLACCIPSAQYTLKQVTTPQGEPYKGLSYSKKLMGVSINRSGEGMEIALRACCAEIDIVKILFLGPTPDQVHQDPLPKDISERHILLLDPVLSSGESAIRAIELLKKDVPVSRIILLNLISAPEGIERVCKQFPALKVMTSEVDVGLKQDKVIPGMGDFGGRYFGTNDC